MINQDVSSIHKIEFEQPKSGIKINKFIIVLVFVLITGALSGFIIAKIKKPSSIKDYSKNEKSVGKSSGIADKKTFKDSAEGILKEGGIDGEGNFHLERPGGVSQNAYLTSSTIDLSQYIGKKVRVWGVTFNAQKAGWLMDVGFIELL